MKEIEMPHITGKEIYLELDKLTQQISSIRKSKMELALEEGSFPAEIKVLEERQKELEAKKDQLFKKKYKEYEED